MQILSHSFYEKSFDPKSHCGLWALWSHVPLRHHIPFCSIKGMAMGLLFLFFLSACTPSSIGYTDDLSCRLTFTDDTIAFDTVFTAVGSYTEVFQVYNRNNAHLSISDIRLAKGWNSPFRINLDGQYGVSFSRII